jgi:NIMA (never in mitosis gene a)-related kinase
MGLKDFEILHRLGKGSFGTVYKCRRVSDGEIYAMKRVNISHMKDAEIGDALTEIRVLASVRHRNVVPFLESFVEKGRELVRKALRAGLLRRRRVRCHCDVRKALRRW